MVCFSLLEVALFVTGGGGTPSCHYNSILPPVSGFGDRKQGRVKINQRFVCSNGELIRYRANDGHPGLTSPNNRPVSAVPTHHYRPSSPKNDQTNGDWISPNYTCLLLLWQCIRPVNLSSEISFVRFPLFSLEAGQMRGSAGKSLLTPPVKGLLKGFKSMVQLSQTSFDHKGSHLFEEENIATGETSQAITSFHFFDYSNFSNFYHKKTLSHWITFSHWIAFTHWITFSHLITFSHWITLSHWITFFHLIIFFTGLLFLIG